MKTKYRALILVGAVAFLTVGSAAEKFTVHEWGTFTSVVGSDGRALTGLEVEEAGLPPFVHSISGFAPANKGWDRPVAGVTVKMETPVIYFYSPTPLSARIEVGFHGGSISQWYPERRGGEEMPSVVPDVTPIAAVNFARGHEGSAIWKIDVLPVNGAPAISARRDWETPQWPRARVSDANRVRVNDEVEGFVFYRGIGNFALPLEVRADGGNVVVSNTGKDEIPFVFVYEKRMAFPGGVVWWSGNLSRGARKTVPLLKSFGDISASRVLSNALPRELQNAGLTAAEAHAMIETWRESYFERDGIRVFWIVPRGFTDAVLPMAITPRPEKLERVLVGRTEVLTPGFETELMRDFAADGGRRWSSDRYFRAYRERVRRLGGTVGVAPIVSVP